MIWSLALYAALVFALAAAILAISYLAGQRHSAPAMGQPYEGGIVSEGSAHVRLSARFYLVAMFFVIFDLESVFIFAWALAARELGWQGYGDILIFAGVLGIALAYLWRIGGLDWYGEMRSGRK
jgi:NADH-quinone oxidoreductase subunit A